VAAALRPRHRTHGAAAPGQGWDERSLQALHDEARLAGTGGIQPQSRPDSGTTPHIEHQ